MTGYQQGDDGSLGKQTIACRTKADSTNATMKLTTGKEIIEIEGEEAKNDSFFEMDKDTETGSRGDRDLSEEMIRIEDHVLFPFYDL